MQLNAQKYQIGNIWKINLDIWNLDFMNQIQSILCKILVALKKYMKTCNRRFNYHLSAISQSLLS